MERVTREIADRLIFTNLLLSLAVAAIWGN